MMVHILTPLRKGAVIPEEAEKMLAAQTVVCRRLTHCVPDEYEHPRLHEAANRNVLKQHATNPYAVWMDHDVVPGDKGQIERACEYLRYNDHIGGVAIDTKDTNTGRAERVGHVVIAFVVMRGWIARSLEYRTWKADGSSACLCQFVNYDMKNRVDICMPLVYMPGEHATETKPQRGAG